jgi:hypothetical protein
MKLLMRRFIRLSFDLIQRLQGIHDYVFVGLSLLIHHLKIGFSNHTTSQDAELNSPYSVYIKNHCPLGASLGRKKETALRT